MTTTLRVNGGSLKTTNIGIATRTPWVRPSDWPTLPTVTSSDDKFVGLYAVFPNQDNFCALTLTNTPSGGTYTVDWGDGNIETVSSATTAYHNYIYDDPDITVTCSRGYKIVTVVVTPGSARNTFTFNILQKHNQAGLASFYSTNWLDIAFSFPSIGATNLTIGSTNPVQHRMLEQAAVLNSGNATNFTFNGCVSLQSVTMPSDTSKITSTASMFQDCRSLQVAPMFDTSNVTTMDSMFENCMSLQTVPNYNTSKVNNLLQTFFYCTALQIPPNWNTANVSNMQETFRACIQLRLVPLYNTGNVSNMFRTFFDCFSLQTVPQFNTANVTNMGGTFATQYGGNDIVSVPLFNTSNVTNMSGMFERCHQLISVPLFDTSKVTDMSAMFSCDYSSVGNLETVPQFNTANVTNMSYMFRSQQVLKSVPAFNTANVTNMSNMFNSCYTLRTIPQFDTSKVLYMSSMFQDCRSLQNIPELNTANVSNVSFMFSGCNSLTAIPTLNLNSVLYSTTSGQGYTSAFVNMYSLGNVAASNIKYSFSMTNARLSNNAVNYLFTNLPTATAQTITLTATYGANTSNLQIANAKGWTVVF